MLVLDGTHDLCDGSESSVSERDKKGNKRREESAYPHTRSRSRSTHLELSATAATNTTEDAELFDLVLAGFLDLREEHERSPLLLHASEGVAALAHDEADAILGDIHDGEVVPLILLEVDVHGADALLRHELYVVAGLVVERMEGSGRREVHEVVDGTGT